MSLVDSDGWALAHRAGRDQTLQPTGVVMGPVPAFILASAEYRNDVAFEEPELLRFRPGVIRFSDALGPGRKTFIRHCPSERLQGP